MSVAVGRMTSLDATFYYLDVTAGTPTLTASAPGRSSATQTETVTGGAVAKLSISPAAVTVPVGKRMVRLRQRLVVG